MGECINCNQIIKDGEFRCDDCDKLYNTVDCEICENCGAYDEYAYCRCCGNSGCESCFHECGNRWACDYCYNNKGYKEQFKYY